MRTQGLSKVGLEQLHEVMAGHVGADRVPGLVLGLSRGEDVYTDGTYRGERILAPELVAAMTTDQLTPGQRDGAGPILDGRGWGFGLSIIDPPEPAGLKGYGWNGGFGTAWANDPGEDLVAILCTQVLAAPGSAAVEADFWRATYRAVAH